MRVKYRRDSTWNSSSRDYQWRPLERKDSPDGCLDVGCDLVECEVIIESVRELMPGCEFLVVE